MVGEGEDRVGQAAPLADLLEEPARRAAAQGRVEDAEREAALVVAGQALHPEHEVDLLEGAGAGGRAGVHEHLVLAATGRDGGLVAIEEAVAVEGGADPVDDDVVVDVAGHRHDHRGRAVVLAPEALDLLAGQGLDRGLGAGDGPAERGVGAPGLLGEELVDDVVGVVVVHGDLVEDHVALGLDVVGGQQRAGDHVAEDVDGQRQVLVEDPGVEAGVLLGGEGVELTADLVERDGDVEGRALSGALEQQVLEEVRGAVQGGGLVARADADPDADRGRADARHVLGDDAQAAGQDGAAHGGVAGVGRSRRAAGSRLPAARRVRGAHVVLRPPPAPRRTRPRPRRPRRRGPARACRGRRSRRSRPGPSGPPRGRPRRPRRACRRPGRAAC